MKFDKAEIARRQLGTSLQLFMDDEDPVSVHVLTAGGMEIAHTLVERSGQETFRSIAVDANPVLTVKTYNEIRNQYWNAFKHFSDKQGQDRDDTALLADFKDEVNEMMLLIGWLDLARAQGCMPIGAQCFQAWFFALHPEKLAPGAKLNGLDRIFPDLATKNRSEQKALLRRSVPKARRNRDVMNDRKTESRKLLLPNNLSQLER